MYILALETTGPLGSAALINIETGNVVSKTHDEPMSHLRELANSCQDLIKNIDKAEISAVAASIGPGSFTGIRICVTTARSMAQALNVPAISVPTLHMFKLKVKDNPIAVIFNARRGQVYGGVFARAKGIVKTEVEPIIEILDPGPYMLTDVLQAVNSIDCEEPGALRRVDFYGDGIDAYERELIEFQNVMSEKNIEVILTPKPERYQNGEMVARVALEKYMTGETLHYDELMPDYMRIAEAEQKLKDGTLKRLREEKLARLRNS